jgi:O-antigen/teichoic acid export membrane protein
VRLKNSNTIQAFWYGLSTLSALGISLVSAALLSRYFDKTEYGTYRQVVYVYSTLLVIFSAGFPRVYAYYLPRYSLAEGKNISLKITGLLFLSGLIFSVVLFVSADLIASVLRNDELGRGLRAFSPVPLLLMPTLGLEGIYTTYRKAQYLVVYNTLTRLITLACIIGPVILFHGSYIHAIYGWIAASVLQLFAALYMKDLPFKGISQEKTLLGLKEIFAYSYPIAKASLWGILILAANQFFISRYFGEEEFGVFSNGFIEIPFIRMITGSASAVLMPVLSKMVHEKNSKESFVELWRSVLTKSATLIYPIAAFGIINARSIIVLIFSEKYEASTIYLQLITVSSLFSVIIIAPLIYSLGKTKIYSRVHFIIGVITWILGYVVVLVFNSPVAFAVFVVILTIVKSLILIRVVAGILKVKFLSLFPVNKFTVLLMHSLIVLFLINTPIQIYGESLSPIVLLGINSLLFPVFLVLTGRFVKINYLEVFNSFYRKKGKETAKITQE